jgi:hypothetical protein
MKGYAPGTDKGPSGESDITSVAWSRENRAIFATSAENGCLVYAHLALICFALI